MLQRENKSPPRKHRAMHRFKYRCLLWTRSNSNQLATATRTIHSANVWPSNTWRPGNFVLASCGNSPNKACEWKVQGKKNEQTVKTKRWRARSYKSVEMRSWQVQRLSHRPYARLCTTPDFVASRDHARQQTWRTDFSFTDMLLLRPTLSTEKATRYLRDG